MSQASMRRAINGADAHRYQCNSRLICEICGKPGTVREDPKADLGQRRHCRCDEHMEA